MHTPGTQWVVNSLETRRQKRKPPVPFITSTLQQDGSRKLGMSEYHTYMHTYIHTSLQRCGKMGVGSSHIYSRTAA